MRTKSRGGRLTVVGLVVGAVALALVAILGTPAWANPVRAPGTVTCSVQPQGQQQATFSPPITKNGNSRHEEIKMELRVHNCVASVRADNPVSGIVNVTMKSAAKSQTANSCSALIAGNMGGRTKGQWKGPNGVHLRPSKLGTTGETWNIGLQVSVNLPGAGTASNNNPVTSFAGNNLGATSTIAATLALTGAQFAAVCGVGGTGSISESSVTGGSVTFG